MSPKVTQYLKHGTYVPCPGRLATSAERQHPQRRRSSLRNEKWASEETLGGSQANSDSYGEALQSLMVSVKPPGDFSIWQGGAERHPLDEGQEGMDGGDHKGNRYVFWARSSRNQPCHPRLPFYQFVWSPKRPVWRQTHLRLPKTC